jgi:prophage antirepressor-like protein
MKSNSLQLFNNPQFGEIRTTRTDSGEPLFCLADVCKILELSAKGVNQRLSGEVISNYPIIDNLGREQVAIFVNEDGLYDVILDSRKPEAKAFRKWVTSEVLPSIRKHGVFATPQTIENILADPDNAIKVFTALKEERQAKEIAQQQVEIQAKVIKESAPKVDYYNNVLQSTNTHTITQVAKELGMSGEALNNRLHIMGVQFKQSGQWLLYSKYQNQDYTKPRTVPYPKTDGTQGTNTITVWTEKGRQFIHDLMKDVPVKYKRRILGDN